MTDVMAGFEAWQKSRAMNWRKAKKIFKKTLWKNGSNKSVQTYYRIHGMGKQPEPWMWMQAWMEQNNWPKHRDFP